METSSPLDPYEQELFKVFDSYDLDNKGSLDREGLNQLCNTLQLQDKYENLSKTLLVDQNRVTFEEFKNALLRILGSMQNHSNEADLDVSPEREVAPIYVSGTKKYGRRSRHLIDDITSPIISPVSVQRSNSTCEQVKAKKYQLKRCTSVPSIPDPQSDNGFVDDVCTEEMLRQAWRKLGVGDDGFLNHSELNLVCEAIGLNKLADSVMRQLSNSNKAVLDYNKRISFRELLEALQQDETWNEFLNTSSSNTHFKESIIVNSDGLMRNSKGTHCIKLGPDGTGYINCDALAELWESAGIVSPRTLIKDLGFSQNNIEVQKLSMVLESEIKAMVELRINHTCNPSVALLQAFITLYQCEIKCLKSILQQICEEKEKLKFDVSEANKRSSLLAQEVDENVAKMEEKTQTQIKLIEQRHSELAKQITKQCSIDKEQWALANQRLEAKIKDLECQESKLQDDLSNAQKYLKMVENENVDLSRKITDLEGDKCILEKCLEDDRLKTIETEKCAREELQRKTAIMDVLQRQNIELKDKNDEMISQIESLNREIVNLKHRNSVERQVEDFEFTLEGIGYASKRRSDESSSEDFEFDSAISGSPRLGKIRKFQDNDQKDCTDSVKQPDLDLAYINQKVSFLNDLLRKNAIFVPQTDSGDNDYKTYAKILETIIEELSLKLNDNKIEVHREIVEKIAQNNRLKDDQVQEENLLLKAKSEELEVALTQLKEEYDYCEDYWQKKLEDERKIYEFEQLQSSEKFNEVLYKLAEFEEQIKKDCQSLPPIDEADALEKQYTDLESEYEKYKAHVEALLENKELEVLSLKEKLYKNVQNTATQTEPTSPESRQLRRELLENTNLYPHETTWRESKSKCESNINENLFKWPINSNADLLTLPTKNELTLSTGTLLPSSIASASKEQLTLNMPIKQKKNRQRVRAFSRNLTKQNHEVQSDSSDSQSETHHRPVDKANEPKSQQNNQVLESRIDYLQKRCKRLQQKLREQQQLDAQLLQHYWFIYCKEKSEFEQYFKASQEKMYQLLVITKELQDKLAKNDLLVKEFFVENSYLLTQNQRLVQQMKMIANTTHSHTSDVDFA